MNWKALRLVIVTCLPLLGLASDNRSALPKPAGATSSITDSKPALLISLADTDKAAPARKIEFPKPIPAPKPIQSSVGAMTNPPLKKVSSSIYEFGAVTLNKQERTITFPGVINLSNQPLEYVLVAKWGKLRESLLRTEVEPYQIHVAMLLLATGTNASAAPALATPTNRVPTGAGQFISKPSGEMFSGDQVSIEVSWQQDKQPIRRRVEDLVYNTEKSASMTNAVWVNNGSRVLNGNFMAQLSGSIVSLISDPDAQINSMTQGHDNDSIWTVNTNLPLHVDTPVQITIKLPEPKSK
jgi:hypothetical protein